MRNPKRISTCLDIIKQNWKRNPDLRLGQLILNAVNEKALYQIEDEDLVKAIAEYYSSADKNEIDKVLGNLINNKGE